MMKEIFERGPISCGIDADPLLNYESGVVTEKSFMTDHVISVVGWGKDAEQGPYWLVRNSWGEFWGEMGYVRVGFGALNVESQCSWAVVGDYTAAEKHNQFPCHEGGDNCATSSKSLRSPKPTSRKSELLSREEVESNGIVWRGNASNSHHLLASAALPDEFTWGNKDGKNFLTAS